ncbi:MAG: dihydrodipicolinate synthase family protein, partial [Variibacter sp.]|nr:dihydrodipicolinate synthase family protein [Variibacter sp.]
RHAAALGFGGALVLPPFYYKGVGDDGLAAYIGAIMAATADSGIPIYLYHFPGMSAVPWSLDLMRRLKATHGARLAGVKDSSGDMPYARAATSLGADFAVFPSNEAVLIEAREGAFAGCISATANLNADLCAAAWRNGDRAALERAVTIRKLFDGKVLVSGVKALVSHIHGDDAWARPMPPLSPFSAADHAFVTGGYDAVRAAKAA